MSKDSVVPDPFSDDLFAPLADSDPSDTFSEELARIAADSAGELDPEPAPAPVAEAPKANEPQVYEYEDGSSVVIEHGSRGWKATLDSGTGGKPEIFYGSTKDELLVNLSAGKINATQKIREMNKLSKLGVSGNGEAPVAQPAQETATAGRRALTPDEVFEIRTQLAENPDAAMESWFQKKTGLKLEELVALAKTGKTASDELAAEAISKDFLGRHPEYVPYEKNFEALIAWLCKYKLNQPLNGRDPNSMVETLYQAGCWNARVLDEAYDDLANDGLLDLQDETTTDPEPVPVAPVAPARAVAPAAPVPTPVNDRIVRETRRPRAGHASLGIRTTETVAGASSDAQRPSSVEELDNLSDDQIATLLADVRRSKIAARRSQ